MKKLLALMTLILLAAASCTGPLGPSQDSGTFELNLFSATNPRESTGEGYDFETGEKVAIDYNMNLDYERMGTYSDLDAYPYRLWAKDRFNQNTRSWWGVGENESVTGVPLETRSGRKYKINIRNEVTRRTRDGVESKYVVTYKAY